MQVRDEDDGELTLNLAPLIDVVFLLLIFFMVATTFVEREKELGVDLPQAETGDRVEEREEIVINLFEDGRIVLDGREVDRDELLETLTAAARQSRDTPVTIRGDERASHGRVIDVMDACRLAGLENLGLMTLDR